MKGKTEIAEHTQDESIRMIRDRGKYQLMAAYCKAGRMSPEMVILVKTLLQMKIIRQETIFLVKTFLQGDTIHLEVIFLEKTFIQRKNDRILQTVRKTLAG